MAKSLQRIPGLRHRFCRIFLLCTVWCAVTVQCGTRLSAQFASFPAGAEDVTLEDLNRLVAAGQSQVLAGAAGRLKICLNPGFGAVLRLTVDNREDLLRYRMELELKPEDLATVDLADVATLTNEQATGRLEFLATLIRGKSDEIDRRLQRMLGKERFETLLAVQVDSLGSLALTDPPVAGLLSLKPAAVSRLHSIRKLAYAEIRKVAEDSIAAVLDLLEQLEEDSLDALTSRQVEDFEALKAKGKAARERLDNRTRTRTRTRPREAGRPGNVAADPQINLDRTLE